MSKDTSVVRISMSLRPELLSRFDDTCQKAGIKDRSRALQMAMRMFITENEWTTKERGQVSGAILFVYNPNVRGIEKDLTSVQHARRRLISSTLHNHLDEKSCLEAVTVRGDSRGIQELSQRLSKQRGVKYVKTFVYPSSID